MKTRLDVINRAFRRLGVKAEDENLTADQIANGGEVLDMLFAEANKRALDTHGQSFGWNLSYLPDEAFLPLANLLAAELAADYSAQPPITRERAMLQLFSVEFPDDRAVADPVYF